MAPRPLSEVRMNDEVPYVLFDCDGCLIGYDQKPRVGMIGLLGYFQDCGYEIRIWSAGGERWAQMTARMFGLDNAKCYRKPEYPIKLDDALDLLGHAPVLQLDDDETKAVEGWNFLLTPCYQPNAFKRSVGT